MLQTVTKKRARKKDSFCIIQPGHIGDVIICLPIAKKLADKGHEVFWPLWPHILPNFTKGNINYVNFLGVYEFGWYESVLNFCHSNNIIPIDLSFNQPETWGNRNTKLFGKQKKLSFDAFKYKLAGVNIKEKWKLSIERIANREQALFDALCNKDKYVLAHFQGSNVRKEIHLENLNDCKLIEICPLTDCIFDWLKIIENAEYLVLIDSAFANLVEQLNFPNKKIFIKRSEPLQTPLLRNEWRFID